MADSAYERAARIKRLVWLEGEHGRAMYGWNHPDNIKWAAARQDEWRFDELAELRRRCDRLEAAKRQHVADEPEQTAGEPNEAERPVERRPVPISITWRKSRHG
jgi:hypothetical protein